MPTETDKQTEEFSPSASFRATMEAVTKGEKDPAKLRAEAAAGAIERLTRDPIPDVITEEGKPAAKPPESEKPAAPAEEQQDGETVEEQEKPAEEQPSEKQESAEAGEQADTLREALRKDSSEAKTTPAEEEMRGERPADSDRVRKRIKHYEGLLSEREKVLEASKKQAAALQARLAELEKKTSGLPDDVTSQLDELKAFRRRYQIEKDPEFQERFGTRINESNELVDEALASVNVSEKLRGKIREMGGISAFLQSDMLIPVQTAQNKTEKLDARGFIAMVMDAAKKTAPDSEAVLRAEMANQRRIETEKKKFLEVGSKEADEYFAKLERAQGATAEQQQQIKDKLDEVTSQFKAAVHMQDWMVDLKPPENADAKKLAEVKAENAHRSKMRKLFDLQVDMPLLREAATRATNQKEMDELGAMLVDSARVFHVERQLSLAQKRIKELETEIDKVRKAASQSTPSRPSTGGRTPADTSGEPKRSDFDSDLKFAIVHKRWADSQGK